MLTRGVVGSVALTLALIGCGAPTEVRTPGANGHDVERDPFSVGATAEKVVLSNGLTVLLDPDTRVPLVAVRVVHRVGWAADPAELPGLAHLTEHLLFHGSRHVADGMHFQWLQESGADFVSGSTSAQTTEFWELVPSSELALALWLESDRMSSGLEGVTETRMQKELRIIARERAERIENVPGGRIDEIMGDFLFPAGHPFRVARVAGPELNRATLDEVRKFHRDHYGPENVLVVLCGDFDGADAKALIRHYFEPIAARPTARPTAPPASSSTAASLHLEAQIDAPVVVISWPSARAFEPGDAELDVVASHLNQVALRPFLRETPILSGVFAQQVSEVSGSLFRIGADLRPGAEPAAALAGIDAVLDKMKQGGIGDDHVRRYAYGWLFELHATRDDLLQRSWSIAHSVMSLGDPDFMKRALERYSAVTPTTVREAVERYLRNDRRVVAFVKPNRDAPLAGRLVARP